MQAPSARGLSRRMAVGWTFMMNVLLHLQRNSERVLDVICCISSIDRDRVGARGSAGIAIATAAGFAASATTAPKYTECRPSEQQQAGEIAETLAKAPYTGE